ncbi:MAG: 30S ribosomal protein S16 [Planctomycetota bacterium]|jgi:small subunit ribosomal protein S16
MATVIRLSRKGRRNRPHYRVGVFDSRTRRDGPPIEYLGHYDPLVEDDEKKVTLDLERITYWLGKGARVTDTVRSFLVKRGVEIPRKTPKRTGTKKKAKSA